MNEAAPEGEAASPRGGGGGSWIAWGAGVFAAVYFLCPPLLLLPYILLAPRNTAPSPVLVVLFSPVIYLTRHVPAYERLMEFEAQFLER